MKDKILNWFATGQTGSSSKVMACCFAGISTGNISHPYDPDDLNRCLLFLDFVPEARNQLTELKKISKKWEVLVENWGELERLFLGEVGLNWRIGGSAPKTYKFMQKIYSQANS